MAGIDLYFTSSASLRLWAYVLSEVMGIESSVTVEGNWLHGLLRHGSSGVSFLTLMNVTGRNGLSRVRIRRREWRGYRLRHRTSGRRRPGSWRSGCDWWRRISSVCHQRTHSRRFGPPPLQLHGSPGTYGELAFDQPVHGRLDGRPVGHRAPRGHPRHPLPSSARSRDFRDGLRERKMSATGPGLPVRDPGRRAKVGLCLIVTRMRRLWGPAGTPGDARLPLRTVIHALPPVQTVLMRYAFRAVCFHPPCFWRRRRSRCSTR